MDLYLDPSDYNMRLYGLAVRPFRRYPVTPLRVCGVAKSIPNN